MSRWITRIVALILGLSFAKARLLSASEGFYQAQRTISKPWRRLSSQNAAFCRPWLTTANTQQSRSAPTDRLPFNHSVTTRAKGRNCKYAEAETYQHHLQACRVSRSWKSCRGTWQPCSAHRACLLLSLANRFWSARVNGAGNLEHTSTVSLLLGPGSPICSFKCLKCAR